MTKIIECDRCVNVQSKSTDKNYGNGWSRMFIDRQLKDLCSMCSKEWMNIKMKMKAKNLSYEQCTEISNKFINVEPFMVDNYNK